MTAFLKKIGLFSATWILVFYAACWLLPSHYFNREYPMWKSKMEVVENPEGHTNFILGDSRAIAGLDTKKLGDSFYNLALGGGTPMEGYYQLKTLLDKGHSVDTLIVSYAPIHLEQSEMFWDRQVKYGFYTPKMVEEIIDVHNPEKEAFWSYEEEKMHLEELSDKKREAWLSYYKFPMQLRTEIGKSMFLRGYTNHKVYSQIKKQKGTYDFGTASFSDDLNVEAQRPTFRPKKILIDYLEKLMDLAEQNHIVLMYVPMPMNKTSVQNMDKSYAMGVQKLDQSLRKKFREVRFIYPSLHTYENENFGDASHLNQKGRLQFTLDFIGTLKTIDDTKSQLSELELQ